MFGESTYTKRRKSLKEKVGKGLILLLGNNESSMNYADNTYHFRQDSTFLYYFGINHPGAGSADRYRQRHGNNYTIDDIVWMGPQPVGKGLNSCIFTRNLASEKTSFHTFF